MSVDAIAQWKPKKELKLHEPTRGQALLWTKCVCSEELFGMSELIANSFASNGLIKTLPTQPPLAPTYLLFSEREERREKKKKRI